MELEPGQLDRCCCHVQSRWRGPEPFRDKWETDVRRFLSRGLTEDELIEACRVAFRSNIYTPWRYFHGVCRNMLTERRQRVTM